MNMTVIHADSPPIRPGVALFPTPIGTCGIGWDGDAAITGVQLPEANESLTRDRLRRRCPGVREASPPPPVQEVIERIGRLLQGEPVDLAAVPLMLAAVPDFNRRVYEVARTIPPGRTLTYGEIAVRLGERSMARAVGQALGANPFPIIVPCHRVVAAGGKNGGFSATGGVRTKLRMLALEGANANALLPLFGDE
jgi:methylated-DNA-[protein]-cysteine S-methyltransferase